MELLTLERNGRVGQKDIRPDLRDSAARNCQVHVPFNSVLMVCVGNICRSPMAMAIWADRLGKRTGGRVVVESAGISALVGNPADPLALTLMAERGLDLTGHRARQLTAELARGAELILVMEEGHRKAVEQMIPMARGRVHRLGRWGNFDIPDPYRRPRAAFEESLKLIDQGLADFEKAFFA